MRAAYRVRSLNLQIANVGHDGGLVKLRSTVGTPEVPHILPPWRVRSGRPPVSTREYSQEDSDGRVVRCCSQSRVGRGRGAPPAGGRCLLRAWSIASRPAGAVSVSPCSLRRTPDSASSAESNPPRRALPPRQVDFCVQVLLHAGHDVHHQDWCIPIAGTRRNDG